MILDYTHNRIIADTITGKFIECFESSLLPELCAMYGGELEAIQMYEDHISDDFVRFGEFYYPLSIVVGGEARLVWIKWSVGAKEDFRDDVPFAYVGADNLKITFANDVPQEFVSKMAGRRIYFGEKTVKFAVTSVYPSPKTLSGKYSQGFVDMMALALTREIERMFSLSGLADSGLEIRLVYAPATYMEHTSENVTYRRLSLADKTSAPRDFWVKWTRKGASTAYTVMDNPDEADIIFEIGEDVPVKIREREYRFLVSADGDKYRHSMGRKNVTEWRELVKRAIKRGEVEQEASENVNARRIEEISDKLNAILQKYGAGADTFDTDEAPIEAPLEVPLEATEAPLEATETPNEPVGGEFEYIEAPAEIDEDSLVEQLIAISSAYDEPKAAAESVDVETADVEEEIEEETVEEETAEEEIPMPDEEIPEAEAETEDDTYEEPVREETCPAVDEQRIREELEAKLRLEYESAARLRAEAEAEELRREQRRLIEENRRLAELARAAEAARIAEEEGRRVEEARLRAKLEAEERERSRLAEAARMAVEERARREEEARREAELEKMRERERELIEERERVEAERRAEAERIRREAEQLRIEAERATMQFNERQNQGMNMLFEEEIPAQPEPEEVVYTYTRKIVRLIFRHNVDPNVTARIQEVMASSIKYYGKEDVYIRVKASIPDEMTVLLDFVRFPEQESELLINIIKILGNSGLGICKVTVE